MTGDVSDYMPFLSKHLNRVVIPVKTCWTWTILFNSVTFNVKLVLRWIKTHSFKELNVNMSQALELLQSKFYNLQFGEEFSCWLRIYHWKFWKLRTNDFRSRVGHDVITNTSALFPFSNGRGCFLLSRLESKQVDFWFSGISQ